MSWARALDGAAAVEAGYRLHRLGLASDAFEVTPGYLRAEEQLRRVTRARLPPAVGWRSVAEALGADAVPIEASEDRAWYARRREAGEGSEGAALAAAVAAFGWAPRVGVTGDLGDAGDAGAAGSVSFVVSPALRGVPCFARTTSAACGGGAVIAAGPGMPATLGWLGAATLEVEAAVTSALPEELPFEARHFALCMAGGSVLVASGVSVELLDRVLADATRVLVPPQHREGVVEKWIIALVKRGLLDQPPGEIERTILGLARRRPDRMLRAWRRGFFVPRGVVVAGLDGAAAAE